MSGVCGERPRSGQVQGRDDADGSSESGIGGSRVVVAGDGGPGPGLFSWLELDCNSGCVPMGTQSRSGFGGSAYKTVLCRITKVEA